MKVINEIKLNIEHSYSDLLNKVAKTLRVNVKEIDKDRFRILRKSIDARDKKDIKYVYNVAVDYDEKFDKNLFNPIVLEKNTAKSDIRPIVVGFGPAGIFASYILALNGLKPIILERGKKLDERKMDVNKFFKTLELNEDSNVCFGEGGAGAFSDGKLNTNNKDKTGIYRFVLETFVRFGAEKHILYENLPHIGTDKLTDIIKNIREEIISLGGEIRYNTKFTYDEYSKYANEGIPIILAIGNSSRDTFRDLINNGFELKPKAFAIGFRAAHRQKLINEAQYGESAALLPAATYKLTYDVGNGHSVYSFCMCPGGYVINSSNFNGYLSINGMSYNDRKGLYANSAIVETITPEDVGKSENALSMIEFQEKIEKKAYELEKGYIPYQNISHNDINEEDIFKGLAKKNEKILDIYEDIGLKFSIKEDIKKALSHFSKIINDFDKAIISGVETRTSSPITLSRDENMMSHKENFYPCGEGLGHGGGILSSAADGVNVGLVIVKKLLLVLCITVLFTFSFNKEIFARNAYLTFDDGPAEYTDEFLKVFKENDVKVTYFCTYDSAERREHIKKINDEGHTIAIHSFRHKPEIVYYNESVFLCDISYMQKMIASLIGVAPIYIRFPFGSSNSMAIFNPGIMKRLTMLLTSMGFKYFDWNVYGGDAEKSEMDPNEIFERIKKQIKNLPKDTDATILCHDTHKHTLLYIKKLIPWLKSEGFDICPITDKTIPIHHKVNN